MQQQPNNQLSQSKHTQQTQPNVTAKSTKTAAHTQITVNCIHNTTHNMHIKSATHNSNNSRSEHEQHQMQSKRYNTQARQCNQHTYKYNTTHISTTPAAKLSNPTATQVNPPAKQQQLKHISTHHTQHMPNKPTSTHQHKHHHQTNYKSTATKRQSNATPHTK